VGVLVFVMVSHESTTTSRDTFEASWIYMFGSGRDRVWVRTSTQGRAIPPHHNPEGPPAGGGGGAGGGQLSLSLNRRFNPLDV